MKMNHMMAALLLCLTMSCRASLVSGPGPTLGQHFASPQGTPRGDGSQFAPWDIKTALADNTNPQNPNHVVRPGDTIWLRGGTYGIGSGWTVTSLLTGTSNLPIVLAQYPGERAVVDGGIWGEGAWTTFWGFEIMNSSTNRTGLSVSRNPGLWLAGPGHRAINMVVHDVGQPAIGFWEAAGPGAEIYGCILWGNGLYDTDAGVPAIRGDGIYAQNQDGPRYISDVISFKNFTVGIKIYAEQTYANGFDVQGCVTFGNNMGGIFADDLHNAITSLTLSSNCSFDDRPTYVGQTMFDDLSGTNHQHLLFANNYMAQTALGTYQYIVTLKGWSYLTLTNNVFVEATTNVSYAQTMAFWEIDPTNLVNYIVDHNSYFGRNFTLAYNDWRANFKRIPFPIIQSGGWEDSSTFTTSVPKQNAIFLRPNKYEPGRAHLIVYNWQADNSVAVDISSIGLQTGQHFQVRDVQNYLGNPVLSATYDPTSPLITVPLNLTACSQLIGAQTHYHVDPNLHTDPTFNAYVIVPSP